MSQVVGRYYRPELDVLRFVAFLMVFLHHALPRVPEAYVGWFGPTAAAILAEAVTAMSFGLCLFFFLSAYLITTLLTMEMEKTGRIRIGDFYMRRLLRIWPLYFFAIALGVALALALRDGASLTMFAYFSGFVGNWYFFDHPWAGSPFFPLWSISIEEQFYLVLPLLTVAVGVRRLGPAAVMVTIASLVALHLQGERHMEVDTAIWTNTASQAIFFGAGILLAVVHRRGIAPVSGAMRLAAVPVVVAAFALATAVFGIKTVGPAPSGLPLAAGYAVVAFGCVVSVIAVVDAPWRFPPVLVHLGKISFGLYVFHVLAMWISKKLFSYLPFRTPLEVIDLAALPIVVVMAMVSYHGLELPFLRLRKRFTTIANRPDEDAPRDLLTNAAGAVRAPRADRTGSPFPGVGR